MSCPRQSESQSVGFKDVKEPRLQSVYGRNARSASYKDTVSSDSETNLLSQKQIDALIKMQAFSRGITTRNNLKSRSWSSSAEDSSRFNEESLDLPTQKSYSKNYVDKLKAELASKIEDNEKLRLSVSRHSSPPASGKARTHSRFKGIFRRTTSDGSA